MAKKNPEATTDRFIVSVRVGPKGQITIPAEARRMFGIREGETLMVMGDKSRGIALLKSDMFYDLMGGMFSDGDKDHGSDKKI